MLEVIVLARPAMESERIAVVLAKKRGIDGSIKSNGKDVISDRREEIRMKCVGAENISRIHKS